ncbi:hypothetical protein [Phytoactinopolyspora halotolerans]|uniref:Uncharacterized protein n=1 Tax=Phytoactinopolyspora halotolerans TaxID=1981512 RepID=A0A6L9S7P9_9ACTN|nr:hypothetical protein [Phytoactinopolyspora halotolerans]NED99989.1 hypothetical protein [Phytoactinopolyspora halotolerans]
MPRNRHRRHRRRRRSNTGRLVAISAMAIAIPLLGWTAIAMVSNDDSTDDEPPAATMPTDDGAAGDGAADDDAEHAHNDGTAEADEGVDTQTTAEPTTDPTPDHNADSAARQAIEACTDELSAGEAVVSEAKTGVGHWTEHIDARTDLLAGRNTEEETRAIWKRTRLAGPDDLERFDAVHTTYERTAGCDDLAAADVPQDLAADAEQCLVRAERTEAAVAAARDAIGDWEDHLHAMADHADGHMTADEAQDKWVEAWENAPTNINAFDEARDELEQAPACPGAGS